MTFSALGGDVPVSIGKLYRSDNKQFVADVDYNLFDKSPTSLWEELTLSECRRVDDGGGYMLESEDRLRYQCYLRKRVNRAVSGLPPRCTYHFTGSVSTLHLPYATESGV